MKPLHYNVWTPRNAGRIITVDEASGYATIDSVGNQAGVWFKRPFDYNGRTVDSTGALLVGELERLDPTIHEPLIETSWGRDLPLREDVTIGDDWSSFTNNNIGAVGGAGTGNGIRNGKSWAGKVTTQAPGVGVDISKTISPLTPWLNEVKYTIFELEAAARTGRPIDQQKIDVVQTKYQMDADEQAYVGDSTIYNNGALGVGGLLNSPQVTNFSAVPNGAAAATQWTTKTPAEILADINAMLFSAWAASGYKVMPKKIGLPPSQFGYIATQIISVAAGNISILKYVAENNIVTASKKGELEFVPMKWAVGAGVGGTIGTAGTVDRMVAYTQEKKYVRFPLTPMQRTPIQYDSIYQKFSYYCRLGVVEFPYPETVAYRDGI